MEELKREGPDRRSFLKGAVLVGGAAAVAGMAACTPASKTEEPAGGTGAATGGTRYMKYPNPDEIGTVHDTTNEETVDLVVIGSGITGLCCGMLVAEQAPDSKVLIIEKMGGPGGNTNFAEINEGGEGMAWEDALARAIEHVDGQMDLTDPFIYANYYADNGKISAWFFDKRGVELAEDHFFYKGHTGSLTIKHLVGQIESDAAYGNVELRLSTQAIALLTSDEHTVTGVQIKDTSSGEYTNVHAKAVMVATGGMGTNTELLGYYTGQDVQKCTEYGQGQDGDGHLLVEYTAHGKSKNVDPTPMWVVVKDMSLESPLSCCLAMQNAGVFVNQTGTRFHSENYPGSFPSIDHSFMQQGKVFSVASQSLIDYFQANGSDAASFYFYQVPTDVSEELKDIGSNPNVYVADTFEELAGLIGVPVEAFVEEMNLYDADAKAGAGDSKFGKDAKYMLPFGDPPYYGSELSTILMQTNNGIRINTDCQVVDPAYEPIVGLYAGGIAVSGFNTCMYTMGTAQHVGLWSGCRAALSIVSKELGGTVAADWFGPHEYEGPFPDFANMELTKPLPGTAS
ncbi:MAG: FAD-binding protein [Bifidobacteriaceae bacterium]|jgi:fumarate reductase flavoprotein subunit|nr:FAD-binding protein [Bifidobacteriaceae bacterium]